MSKMETSDKPHKFSCDFGKDFMNGGAAGKLSGRRESGRRKIGGPGPRRRFRWEASGLATPIGQWKSDGAKAASAGGERIRRVRGGVSARKLAAGMCHLAAALNSGRGVGGGGMAWLGQHGRFNRLPLGHEPSVHISKSAKKGGTNCDQEHVNALNGNEVCQIHSSRKFVTSHPTATTTAANSTLQVELSRAQNRVKELESERLLVKKKLKQFLMRLSEEKASWKRREEKMLLKIDDLKNELQKGRKHYQKLDFINSKLLNDLTDAKSSAKQLEQEYEKEKNARESLEDLCRDLSNDVEDHRATMRGMRVQCASIQEEVEEERKMLQMAEVWREERVQMKLIDAKLMLEEKYYQMNNLIADLENLLRTSGINPEMIKMTNAEGINLEMQPFNVQDGEELCYTSHMVNDVDTAIENLQDSEIMETGCHECKSYFFESHWSRFRNGSLEACELSKIHSIDHEKSSGNANFKEIATCVKDQRSSFILGGGTSSLDGISVGSIRKVENANQESLNSSAANSISSMEEHKNERPSVRKLWRSTGHVADVLKTTSVDENRRPSNGPDSPKKLSRESVNQNELVAHWCSPGQRNPHVARAMRGCIEWPRGIRRNSLKAGLLEASLESQKKQLHNVLKQRI